MPPTQIFARLGSCQIIARGLLTRIFQRSHIVETEPFSETFGPKAQRKRPRIDAGTFEELSQIGAAAAVEADTAAVTSGQAVIGEPRIPTKPHRTSPRHDV